MNLYDVRLRRTLTSTYYVEANSESEAMAMVRAIGEEKCFQGAELEIDITEVIECNLSVLT